MKLELNPVFIVNTEPAKIEIVNAKATALPEKWSKDTVARVVNGMPTCYMVQIHSEGPSYRGALWYRVRFASHSFEGQSKIYFFRYASCNLWIPKEIFEGLKQMADAVKINPGEQKEI